MTLFIIDKTKYSYDFIHDGLPKYISKSFYEFSCDKKYKGIQESLSKEYEIDLIKIADVIRSAIRVSENDSSYIITINDRIKCDNNALSMLLRFLNFGSRTVKGASMITDFIVDTNKKLPLIYKLFKFCGGCALWE